MMIKKKRRSGCGKRVRAYVQGHHRKKPVYIYIKEKKIEKARKTERESMYTSTNGVLNVRKREGPVRLTKEQQKDE